MNLDDSQALLAYQVKKLQEDVKNVSDSLHADSKSDPGIIARLREIERTIEKVRSVEMWAFRFGLAALTAFVMQYVEWVKEILKVGQR
jgi:hypothetical protein